MKIDVLTARYKVREELRRDYLKELNMTKEQLEKGNKIAKQIENAKANIEAANYTQFENVVIRNTHLYVNGLDKNIEIPESLFRIVGKLVLSEYRQKLIELEDELRSL